MRTLLFAPIFLVTVATHAADNAAASFQAKVQPFLTTHCVSCHEPEKQKATLRLDRARSNERLVGEQGLWFRALDEVGSHAMPPEEAKKQPSERERAAFASWVRGDFSDLLRAKQRKEGRAHLRRLTRTEYANTIQDLFGIRPAVGLNLPIDGRVGGYDKVSAALPLSASGAA